MKVAIIDGDSIAYAIGWIKKKLGPDNYIEIILAVDKSIEKVINKTGATHLMGFLGGVQPTFRSLSANVGEVFGTNMKRYKESRGVGGEDWYLRNFYLITHRLRTKYGFKNVEFIEADDAVIIMANDLRSQKIDHVICSPDKDLKQFSGVHYDYAKDELYTVSKQEAEKNFWKQMIMGDSVDDIEGQR